MSIPIFENSCLAPGAASVTVPARAKWSGKRDSNPRPSAWKADALATELFPLRSLTYGWMVEGGGFEPPKASPTDLQSVPFGHSGTPPLRPGGRPPAAMTSAVRRPGLQDHRDDGAGEGTRTPNHLITNEMLYQLSYASGAVAREKASAKIGVDRGSVKARRRKAKRQPRDGRKDFPSRVPGCLFPRKQGVTGMNPTAFPASLTGRIWFFCRTTDHNYCISDCSRPTFVPLTTFDSRRRFVRRLQVGYEPQVIHHRNRAFDAATAGRLGRPTSADGGADSRSGQSLSFVPFPLAEGLPPQPCRPMSLRSPYPRSATRIARAMLQWRAARAGSWP